MKKQLVLFLCAFVFTNVLVAQVKIEGRITNIQGEPIPGVNVIIKGTTEGTISNEKGYYTISNVPAGATLVYSYIGMLTEEVSIENQSVIDLVMVEDIMSLDEVVVIGYGTVKRRDLTGAVSSVKSEEINRLPTHSPIEAIQGKVTGVDIVRSSGSAGAGVEILVRGTRSINGENAPLFIIDGVQGGSINDLNPNDIESIEVLKDASTTAIYGYQGAGGVIIITTKKAKAGRARVSYNGYYGINGLTPYPEGRMGQEYIDFRREAYRTTGKWDSPDDDPAIFGSQWEAVQKEQWVNWIDLMLNNGSLQNHQISVSGGTDKTTSYLSAGYFKEIGAVKDDFSRYNIRLNIDHNISKRLKTGAQIQVTYSDRNTRKDAFGKAISATPLGTPYDEDGNIVIYPIVNDNATLSPLTDLRPNAAVDNTIGTRVFTSSFLEIEPVKGISFRSNLGANLNYEREGIFNDSASMAQINTKQNEASVNTTNSKYINWDNILTFSREFKNHVFTLTALTSYTWNERDYFTASGIRQQLTSPLFYRLAATDPESRKIDSYYQSSKTLSLAGRINYSYRGKYLLTATYRTDGASQLAPGNKWSSFPSFAVAWRISDEPFMQNIGQVNNLKLRLSYGVTGNASIPPYGTQSLVVPAGNMSFGEVAAPAYSFNSLLQSHDLTWERSKTLDIGLETGLFNNRLNVVADYYYTNTTGILLDRPLPVSAGGMVSSNSTFSIWQNIGNTQNKGIEIELNSVNIKTRNFKWSTSLTFSRNREKIVSLIEDKDIIIDEENSLLIGHPIHSFYTYKKIGIWQTSDSVEMARFKIPVKPGDIKLADLNNDSTISGSNDRTYVGSSVPDWVCGLQNTLEFKGFDLTIYLFARWGQMIENELLGRYNPSGTGNGPAYIDYWTPENPTNDFPRPHEGYKLTDYIGYQTLYLVDGSYFKIKNITLGYTLPKKISEKVYIRNLRVYVTASNILTIARSHLVKYYDPENRGSEKAPMSRQLVFGVNVDF
jgi:TonB-linked SusC/RagA family outer membrane protein